MWEIAKWVAAILFLLATFIMYSPQLAATSIAPWVCYLIGNIIWTVDSAHAKNTPWVVRGSVFCVIDVLAIYVRIMGIEILHYIGPYIKVLENIL